MTSHSEGLSYGNRVHFDSSVADDGEVGEGEEEGEEEHTVFSLISATLLTSTTSLFLAWTMLIFHDSLMTINNYSFI